MGAPLEIAGAHKRTEEGNNDEYYGGGGVAYVSTSAACAGVPLAIRSGKTVGVIESGKIVEYIWHPNDTSNTGLVKKTVDLSSYAKKDADNLYTGSNTFQQDIVFDPQNEYGQAGIGARQPNGNTFRAFYIDNNGGIFVGDFGTYVSIGTDKISFASGMSPDQFYEKYAFNGTAQWKGLTQALASQMLYIDPVTGLISRGAAPATSEALSAHVADHANPHKVTLEQARAAGNTLADDVNMNSAARIINLPLPSSLDEPVRKREFDSLSNMVGRTRDGIDCSANPQYPIALRGDRFEVTAAGKIGGPNGIDVEVYDEVVCKVKNDVAGDHATVGANFYIVQGNVVRGSEQTAGILPVATTAEALAATNNDRAMTPLKAKQLFDDQKKNYELVMSVSRGTILSNEALFVLRNAGVVSSIVTSGLSNVKVKTTLAGTYVTPTFPIAVATNSTLYIQFDFTNSQYLNGAISVAGKDN